MAKDKSFPKNCLECEYNHFCRSAYYGGLTCRYKDVINKSKSFPENCSTCQYSHFCRSSHYGSLTCKYRDAINEARISQTLQPRKNQ